jgi:hypothetical protein
MAPRLSPCRLASGPRRAPGTRASRPRAAGATLGGMNPWLARTRPALLVAVLVLLFAALLVYVGPDGIWP